MERDDVATTKIWPVRDSLARVLDYAENHLKTANPDAYTAREMQDLREVLGYAADADKTARQFYVTGVNCVGELAYRQMSDTKLRFGKAGGNLAYHIYQSFAPGEVTPERCHSIGVELARRLWGARYEVLVTTHLNTRCLHNHLVVNSVSFVDGKKLDNNFGMYFGGLRKESDRLCTEYGLSVIEKPKPAGDRHLQKAEARGEPTMWNIIRADMDAAVRRSMTERQFYGLLRQWGYTLALDPKRKYPTIRAPGMTQNLRLKTLGEPYTQEGIRRRLLENVRPERVPQFKPQARRYTLRGKFKYSGRTSGLQSIYVAFLVVLREIKRSSHSKEPPQRFTPELREAVRRMQTYSRQTRLLCRNKIETSEQLTAFIDGRKERRRELERERGRVYGRMKSAAKSPEKLEELKAERDTLSAQIKEVRTELFLAGGILRESEAVRRKVRTQREFDVRRREAEQTQLRKEGTHNERHKDHAR